MFVATAGEGGFIAGLTDLLLMVYLQAVVFALALGQHLVQGREVRGRNGVEKRLDHEGLDRRPIETRTRRFGESAIHAFTDVAWTWTIGYAHAMAAEAARRESLEERRAFPGGGAWPQTPLLGVALSIFMQADLVG